MRSVEPAHESPVAPEPKHWAVRDVIIGGVIGALLFLAAVVLSRMDAIVLSTTLWRPDAEQLMPMALVAATLTAMCAFNYALLTRLTGRRAPSAKRRQRA